MKQATVFFPPKELRRDAFFKDAPPKLIVAFKEGRYERVGKLPVGDKTGDNAAEECFDLTNNPSRDDERGEHWHKLRSLCVGDIVQTDEGDFLCASMGWQKIEPTPPKAAGTRPGDYLHVLAWGRQLASHPGYIANEQERAFKAGAPIDAIYESNGEWKTIGECVFDTQQRINNAVEKMKQSK